MAGTPENNETEALYREIEELVQKLRRFAVDIGNLEATAQAMCAIEGGGEISADLLRRSREELCGLLDRLRKCEKQKIEKIQSLRRWLWIALIAAGVAGVVIEKYVNPIGKMVDMLQAHLQKPPAPDTGPEPESMPNQ